MARDVVFSKSNADDAFGFAVGVDIGRVPGVEAAVEGCFEEGEGLERVVS